MKLKPTQTNAIATQCPDCRKARAEFGRIVLERSASMDTIMRTLAYCGCTRCGGTGRIKQKPNQGEAK